MPLFQQSVIKKHLESFDKNHIEERWQLFRGIFHTAEKQQNIRNSKEEQYQEGFLRDLFVTVLGYTINPEVNFNLLTEQKNVNNSKKADGAVLLDGRAIAVIELKGTETTDLNKIEIQAFGYKNNQPGCNYVITSNFEKLRFYIDNTTQQEEFNLFTLTKPQFELLYACLAWESISKNTPMQILNESVSKENIITKSLYKDYSEFKRALFANLVEMNPQYDKLVLFKKTQKLLDRFLFIFFAEDRLLLPTNLIFRINKEWENIIAQRIQVSLYDRYKMYFNDLNVGAKVTLPAFGKKTGEAITAEFEIFAYNGGLFQPDDILDNIQIEDTLLHSYTQKMSHYNFESDVDVNILGHIFENSLNEIDEIKSEIEGNVLEKTKTRRKKDGVFYTPKYITKYIVDNTIGKLCTEKKDEIGLRDEDYVSTTLDGRSSHYDLSKAGSTPEDVERQSRRRSRETGNTISKTKKKALLDKLTDYRNWLLDLTICDPACGSGAFLNQALEFLIAEHRYVDELQAKLLGDSLILSDIENSILERNIYGVDLNDESVEIAKLSLWLRTAQKGRKLNSLNNNIKCGNSLIDDPAVAGDKAFSWEKEFPEVFKEKNKFAYHITTALHDSRTSERMINYKARERRFEGTKPEAEVFLMTKDEEELIAMTVSEIVKEDKLNIAAFNLCLDHMHILLVCEEEDVPKIMHKIKGRTARVCNAKKVNNSSSIKGDNSSSIKGINPLGNSIKTEEINTPNTTLKDGSTPFWTQKYGCKPINDDDHLWNTLNYIDDNRAKHNLPNNPKLKTIIAGFVKTYEDCFKPEYKGGFDVVIGNPPYVRMQGLKEHYFEQTKYYESKFISAKGNYDIYALFMEKSMELISDKGIISYILPHKFLVTDFGVGIRSFFKEKNCVDSLIHFGSELVFNDAATYTCIINLTKNQKDKILFKKLSPKDLLVPFDWDYMYYKNLSSNNWDLQSEKIFDVIAKLNKQRYKVEDVFDKIFQGIATSLDEVYVFQGIKDGEIIKGFNPKYDYPFEIEVGLVKPFIKGNQLSRNCSPQISNYVIFPYNIIGESATPMIESEIASKFPKGYAYLEKFETQIKGRENGKMDRDNDWFLYIYPKNLTKFHHPKIMTQEISLGCNMTYDHNGDYYHPTTIYSFVKNEKFQIDDKFYLGILNSRVMWFFLKNTGTELGGGYFRFKTNYLKPFPLPDISANAPEMILKVNHQLDKNKEFQTVKDKFSTYFSSQYQLDKLPGKLEKWYELEFVDFIKELNKAIKGVKGTPLTKKDEFEWMDLFEENKKKAVELKAEIDKTDKEIDEMVYELYELTEEEIKIVEGE